MKSTIYEYDNYVNLTLELIEHSPSGERGRRKKLAEFIGCQVSHISGVLGGTAHFSAEQAEAASRFFGLNPKETEFYLLLLQYNRAGTSQLQELYRKQLEIHRKENSNLKKRTGIKDEIKIDQELRYYSSWQFGAVHVLISIPEYQTRESISQKLEMDLERTDYILSFLEEAGLIEKVGGKYSILRPSIHLDRGSPTMGRHHTNWRMRTIREFDSIKEKNFHFSSVVTLSVKDIERVREVLSKALSEAMSIITESEEEELASFNMDFFRM